MEQQKTSLALQEQVMQKGNCTGCGMCVGLCPYVKAIGENIAYVHNCELEDGNCFQVCPRTQTDWAAIDRQVFSRERTDHVLGNYANIYYARSLNQASADRGQYGGVVSEITSFLLEKGYADGAVLTKSEENRLPRPAIARNRDEVLACAGSNYTATPVLAALNHGAKSGMNNIAVVGRPCQVLAVRKMQKLQSTPGHNLSGDKVGFVIGLFCFWSLQSKLHDLLEAKTQGSRRLKVDIPNDMVVHTEKNETVRVPIDEIRPLVREECHQCFDPTSEFADLSVGSTEHDPQWNTLVVRSAKGQKIVDEAVAEKRLKIKPYPADRLPLLLNAVRNKKVRTLESLDLESNNYLVLEAAYKEGVLKGGVGR